MDSDITETSANVLTSTMGSVLSNSGETNENPPAVDSLPSSSSDASNVDLSVRKKVPDDPISSTSDMGDGQFERNNDMSLPPNESELKTPASRSDIDNDEDLFANECNLSHITTEKITENVEDIVSDLENLLGNSADDFPARKGNSLLDPDLDDELLFSVSSFDEKKTEKPSISDNLQLREVSVKKDGLSTITEVATGSVCQTSTDSSKVEKVESAIKEEVSEAVSESEKLTPDETGDKVSQTTSNTTPHLIQNNEEKTDVTDEITEILETSKSEETSNLILTDVQMKTAEDVQMKTTEDVQMKTTEDVQMKTTEDVQVKTTEDVQMKTTEDLQMKTTEDAQMKTTEDFRLTTVVRDDIEPEVFQAESAAKTDELAIETKESDTAESVSMDVVSEEHEAMETDETEVNTCVEDDLKKNEENNDTNDPSSKERTQSVEVLEAQSTEMQADEEIPNIADAEVQSKENLQIPEASTKQTNEKVPDEVEKITAEASTIITDLEETNQDESMIIDEIGTLELQKESDIGENVPVETQEVPLTTVTEPESTGIPKTIESKEFETEVAESTTKDEEPITEASLENKVEDVEPMEYETTESETFTKPDLEVEKTEIEEKSASDVTLKAPEELIQINSDLHNEESENTTEPVKAKINESDSDKNNDLIERLDVEINEEKKDDELEVREGATEVPILAESSEATIEPAHIEPEMLENVAQKNESQAVKEDVVTECSKSETKPEEVPVIETKPEEVPVIETVKDPDSTKDESPISSEHKEKCNITEKIANEDQESKEEIGINLDVHKKEDENFEAECSSSKIDDNAPIENMETDIDIKNDVKINAEENVESNEMCIDEDLKIEQVEEDTKNMVEEAVENIAIDSKINEEVGDTKLGPEEVTIQSENKEESVELVQTNDSKAETIKEEDTKMAGNEEQTMDSLGEVKETLEKIDNSPTSTGLSTLDNTDYKSSKQLNDAVTEISDNSQAITVQPSVAPHEAIDCTDKETTQLELNIVEEIKTKLDSETPMESQCIASVSSKVQESEASPCKELTICDNLKQSESIESDPLIVRESKNSILLPISETINVAVETAMKKASIKSVEWNEDIYVILPETTCETSTSVNQPVSVNVLNSEASVKAINTCEPMETNDDIPMENKEIVSKVADFKEDSGKLENEVMVNITDDSNIKESTSQDTTINSSENIVQVEKSDVEKKNIVDLIEENNELSNTAEPLTPSVSSTINLHASKELPELAETEEITKPNEIIIEEAAIQDVKEESAESQVIKPDSPKLIENIPSDIKANEDLNKDTPQEINLTNKLIEDNKQIEDTMNLVESNEVQIEKPQSNKEHTDINVNNDLVIPESDKICKQSDIKNTETNEESKTNIEENQSEEMTNEILNSVNSITEHVGFDSQEQQEMNVDSSQADFEPEIQPSDNMDIPKTESLPENISETNSASDNLNFNEQSAPMEIDNEINDEDELVKAALHASTSASHDIMDVTTCNDQSNEHPDFSNENDLLKAAQDAINRDQQESEELALIQAALESQNRENDEQILIKAATDAQNNLATEEAKKNAEEAERKSIEAARKAAEAERKAAEAARQATEAAEKKAVEAAAKMAAEAAAKKAAEAAEKKAAEAAEKKAGEAAEKKAAEAAAKKAAEAERKAIEAARKQAEEAAQKKAAEAAQKKAEAAQKKAEEAAQKKAEVAQKKAETAQKKAEEAAQKKAEAAQKKAEAAQKKAEEAAQKKAAEAAEKKAAEIAQKKAIEAAEKKAAEAAEKKAAEAAEKKAAEAAEKKAAEAKKKAAEAAEKKAAEAAEKKAVEAAEKKAAEAEKKAAEAAEKKAAEVEKKAAEAEKITLTMNKAKNIEGYKMPLNIVVDTLPTTSISVIKEAESTTNEDTEICQKEVSSDEDKQAEYSSKISQNQELKLTIRKNKAEEPTSILKIYDPKNPNTIEISPSESETEPEETPIPKLIIKQSQCSPKVLSPLKITIKPVMKAEEQQTQKSSPKLIIKPIVKPEDDVKHIEEKHHSPKITIKPIIKPPDDLERCNSPKITIKPIIKPTEASTSPKIKIKPIVKPEEVKDEAMMEEDETKERIVLKINKNNISHKEVKKVEEKETEKLAKIKLKFSKEGRHAHIVNEEMMEVEQKVSTKRHNPEEGETEVKKQKLDVTPPEHIPKETTNPENINVAGPSQIDAIVIEDSLEASDPVVELTPEPPPVVVAPAPRRRGRPRKVPLEVREEFKDPKENVPVEVSRVETATETASGRPKRSCRGPSVRTTLGIKPRKPRGAGRGRGRGRGAAVVVEAVTAGVRTGRVEKEPKKEKITESKLKLLKEAAITAQVAESLENQDVEMKVEEIESISIIDVQEEKLRGTAKLKAASEEPKLEPSDVVMYEEETRMSAETNSRAQTPAKQVVAPDLVLVVEESQSSVQSTATTESIKARKNPRSEIQLDPDGPVVSADQLAEYYWNGAGPYMLQEQVAQFLGIKSFKRKYPGIQRRPVDMQERDFIRESGLTSEHMCDLGLTAVSSADILDIMYSDFQNKYEEYCKYKRDQQTKDITNKQKALSLAASQEKNKLDIMQQAVESAAQWNVAFNKSRRDDRRACMDLQTYTINYPKGRVKHISKPKIGNYPIALVPGQYTDYFKTYTPTELNNLPLNTMLYHPINLHNEEDSQSDGSGSETDSSSSGSSSDSDSSEEDCNICTPPVGLKKAVV